MNLDSFPFAISVVGLTGMNGTRRRGLVLANVTSLYLLVLPECEWWVPRNSAWFIEPRRALGKTQEEQKQKRVIQAMAFVVSASSLRCILKQHCYCSLFDWFRHVFNCYILLGVFKSGVGRDHRNPATSALVYFASQVTSTHPNVLPPFSIICFWIFQHRLYTD